VDVNDPPGQTEGASPASRSRQRTGRKKNFSLFSPYNFSIVHKQQMRAENSRTNPSQILAECK